jgi:hypothetical protein
VDRHWVSVRRACDCVGLARSAYYTELVNWLARDADVMVGPGPAGRRTAQSGLLEMLPAVAAGRLWLESQTHLSGV